MLTRIGKFEIVKKLGEGAMGEVYLARDPLIGREVAIKTIHANAAMAADARDRFFREAFRNGYRVPQMVRFPRFRQMIEAEKADPRLAKRLKQIMEWEQDRPSRRPAP